MSLVRAYDAVNRQVAQVTSNAKLEKRVAVLEERVEHLTAALCKLQNIPLPKPRKLPQEEEVTCCIN